MRQLFPLASSRLLCRKQVGEKIILSTRRISTACGDLRIQVKCQDCGASAIRQMDADSFEMEIFSFLKRGTCDVYSTFGIQWR
jgi:hypothetical protein